MTELVTIVGTGPAGLTAAIYAARAHLNPLCLEGDQPGGQLTLTSDVENYPGFEHPILGPELMEAFRKQALRFETRIVSQSLVHVDLSHRPFLLRTSQGSEIYTKSLIIATGASAQWLGLPSEQRLRGKGVSACATCDGFFFKNQTVAVVGGGDTALEEALFLTRFANGVIVIHRRDQFRASKVMQEKVFNHSKIQVIWDSVVEEVLGELAVQALRLKNLKTQSVSEISVQGLFVAIGHQPNTTLFQPWLQCDPKGYLMTHPSSTQTSVPGVFAAGDVADSVYRQAITAAGTGCQAAIDVERFLEYEGDA